MKPPKTQKLETFTKGGSLPSRNSREIPHAR